MKDHNGTLEKELENLQNLYINYILQMQIPINQRAIEALVAKKTIMVILVTPATIIPQNKMSGEDILLKIERVRMKNIDQKMTVPFSNPNKLCSNFSLHI